MADVVPDWWDFRRTFSSKPLPLRVDTRNPSKPLWRLDDVLAALELDPTSVDVTEVTEEVPGQEDIEGYPLAFVPTGVVLQLADDDELFKDRVAYIVGAISARILRARAADPGKPQEVVSLDDVRATTFSIAMASRILSRDPQIIVGRESLFAFMRDLGWIDKDLFVFIPATAPVKAGWLVRNRVWDRNAAVSYNQVRVTRSGLAELHARLGGISVLTIDAPTTPALLEV